MKKTIALFLSIIFCLCAQNSYAQQVKRFEVNTYVPSASALYERINLDEKTGVPATCKEGDIINVNGILYVCNNTDSFVAIGGGLWSETGNTLHPVDTSREIGIGTTSALADLDIERNGAPDTYHYTNIRISELQNATSYEFRVANAIDGWDPTGLGSIQPIQSPFIIAKEDVGGGIPFGNQGLLLNDLGSLNIVAEVEDLPINIPNRLNVQTNVNTHRSPVYSTGVSTYEFVDISNLAGTFSFNEVVGTNTPVNLDDAVGIGFGVEDGAPTTRMHAAITAEPFGTGAGADTGGVLHFATYNQLYDDTGGGNPVNIPVHMTLNHNGSLILGGKGIEDSTTKLRIIADNDDSFTGTAQDRAEIMLEDPSNTGDLGRIIFKGTAGTPIEAWITGTDNGTIIITVDANDRIEFTADSFDNSAILLYDRLANAEYAATTLASSAIIGGVASATGTIDAGMGFAVAHTLGTGLYTITFNKKLGLAFGTNDVVSVVVTPKDVAFGGRRGFSTGNITTNGFDVFFYDPMAPATGVDTAFSFMVMGRRPDSS